MNKEVKEIKDVSKFKSIVKGCLLTCLITYLSILIYSIVLAYTNVSDTTIPTVTICITMFAIFLSTSIFCRQIGSNGLVNGGIISCIYIGIVYIIGSVSSSSFILDKYSILMIITCITSGVIGGIVGVNLRSGRRQNC